MIERITASPSVHLRHYTAPLLVEREQYLNHLLQKGLGADRVRSAAAYLLHIVRTMELTSLRMVELIEIEAAGERWKEYTGPERRGTLPGATASYFVRFAKQWLSFHGMLVLPMAPADWFDAPLAQFTKALAGQRGLAAATVKSYSDRTYNFLRWAAERGNHLSQLTGEEANAFVRLKRTEGWTAATLATQCQALRSFFAYAESQGWCATGTTDRIRSPRVPAQTTMPKGPKWAEVRRLIRSVNGKTVEALRAKAMLLLYAIYALRSSEVARLRLEDFDWRSETFTVRRAKGGGVQQYPIQYEVGEAILAYLRYGRPRCACRQVFVTLHLPYRAIGAAGMWLVVAKRMEEMGLETKHRGPHALRHACATYLLKKGHSLQEIAEFLGHRNLQSVGIYAKHDQKALRAVAAFRLTGIC